MAALAVKLSWESLTWRQKRQVLKYAGFGQEHPDKQIADAAERWAQAVLAPRNSRRWSEWGLGVVVDLLTGSGSWTGTSVAERRAARKILKVAGGTPPEKRSAHA